LMSIVFLLLKVWLSRLTPSGPQVKRPGAKSLSLRQRGSESDECQGICRGLYKKARSSGQCSFACSWCSCCFFWCVLLVCRTDKSGIGLHRIRLFLAISRTQSAGQRSRGSHLNQKHFAQFEKASGRQCLTRRKSPHSSANQQAT